MILDDLKNFSEYFSLNESFKKVAGFILENDISEFNTGKYNIDNDNLYLNIDEYETKNLNDSLPEAHKNYIDIQIVLKGNEKIGYTSLLNGITKIDYNPEKDIEFFDAKCDYLCANNSKFFIFFPQDIHHPCITDLKKSKVKKAVFKIKI